MLKTMRRAGRISEFLVLVLRHDPVRIGPTSHAVLTATVCGDVVVG
jgi:hypothetical protein